MLNVGELSRISKELILGREPTLTTPEAMEARRDIAADLAKMRTEGIMPDLPYDFDDLPDVPVPPTAPPPTEAERLESKTRVIRNNLGSGWAFALSIEAEEKAEQEVCGALTKRIWEGPPILPEAERDAFLAEIAALGRTGDLAPWTARSLNKLVNFRAMPPKKKRKKKRKR